MTFTAVFMPVPEGYIGFIEEIPGVNSQGETLDDRAEADRRLKDMVARYHKTAPGLASWLEENIPEALAVFAFPAAHRKRLRTNNGLERLIKEIIPIPTINSAFPRRVRDRRFG